MEPLNIIIYTSLLIIFFLLSAFFSGSETGFISVNRIKIRHSAKNGDKRAHFVYEKLLKNPQKFLAIALVGTNIANISASVIFKETLTGAGIDDISASMYSTLVMSPILLIIGEILPKAIFHQNATKLSMKIYRVFYFFFYLFYPLVWGVNKLGSLVSRLFKVKEKSDSFLAQKEEVRSLFELSSVDGEISKTEGAFINGIFSYTHTTAREIMTPLISVVSLEVNTKLKTALKLFMDTQYSKIPVYANRVDNVVGYISAKDLVYVSTKTRLKDFLIDACFVPETKKICEIHQEMQQKRLPLVFVVDEYGGTSGLITYEDIAEEIVGDFLDKTIKEKDHMVIVEDEEIIVPGKVDVDDANENYDLAIEKDGFETVAGFVTYFLGRIPKISEQFEYKNNTFIVEEATDKSVEKVRIVPIVKDKKVKDKK